MQRPTKTSPLLHHPAQIGSQYAEEYGWRLAAHADVPGVELQSPRRSAEPFVPLTTGRSRRSPSVVLADGSANGKIRMEGRQCSAVLNALWEIPHRSAEPSSRAQAEGRSRRSRSAERFVLSRTKGSRRSLEVGAGIQIEQGFIYCLRSDLYFVHTAPAEELITLQTLHYAAAQRNAFVTVTDITHGRAELLLVGPKSAELLSRLCGLDFYPTAFPNLTAKYSSVAKTRQLIIRRDFNDRPAYSLIGGRSFGAYLWDTIMHSGYDLGIRAASPIHV